MIKSAYWHIDQLPGLSPQEVAQLRTASIPNTQILLEQVRSPASQRVLAERLNLGLHVIVKWTVLSDLARIPSVGCYYCGLLLHVGILSLPQLVQTPPDRIHKSILRLQVATLRRKDLCPPVDLVQQWVKEGRLLLESRS
jgi:hypothetical protein